MKIRHIKRRYPRPPSEPTWGKWIPADEIESMYSHKTEADIRADFLSMFKHIGPDGYYKD